MLGVYHQKTRANFDKFVIKIYIHNIENRITFKLKSEYYLELLMLKNMKLLRSIQIKITKDKNVENKPQLEIFKGIIVIAI